MARNVAIKQRICIVQSLAEVDARQILKLTDRHLITLVYLDLLTSLFVFQHFSVLKNSKSKHAQPFRGRCVFSRITDDFEKT